MRVVVFENQMRHVPRVRVQLRHVTIAPDHVSLFRERKRELHGVSEVEIHFFRL